MITEDSAHRWTAHPLQAWLIRAFAFVLPIVGSIVFVHFASRLVAVPTSSFVLFIAWWLAMSGAATVVLFGLERALRRVLPLVALYRLSLVFPDAAPSRFRAALRSKTTETLEQRVAEAKRLNDRSTPIEAAERLLALVSDLDSHDPLTRGHSDRVRAYAQMIGQELHLDPAELELLNWSALLHDIGKLSVPTEILSKAGSPTDGEWDLLRRHPELGQELISPLEGWLGDWSLAVPQHHENWNGGGYPRGIAGEQISLAARIVAVADVFDVITSARSYKSPFSSAIAREEIARCAGTQFDPRVVRAFLNISLGRLRLVMGPVSWLAHAPILARMPLTPAIGTVAASVATVATAVTTGLVATPPAPVLASTAPLVRNATRELDQVTREDVRLVAGVERAGGGARVTSLHVVGQPTVGRARTTAGHGIEYTPPPDFHGTVSVEYEACWAGRGCGRGTLLIRVLSVNDPPTARNDRASTPRGVPVEVDVLRNDSDVEGDRLSVLSVSRPAVGVTKIVGGLIRWTPPPAFVGAVSFRYSVTDHKGGTSSARVTVRVTGSPPAPKPAVKEAPPALPAPAPAPARSEPLPTSQAPAPPPPAAPSPKPKVLAPVKRPPPAKPAPPANAAPQARPDGLSVPEGGTVLVDVLANDSDPDGDQLSIASVGAPTRGAVDKVGDRLKFTAPSDFVGQVTFTYTIADPRGATDTAEVSVDVLLVNAPPSFTPGSTQSVAEDAGPQTVPGWARNISPGAASEAGQSVTFLVSNDNGGLFSDEPRLDSSGTLRYTPAPNAHGSATVTVRAKDDGGVANGGSDTSAPKSFTITVTPVNDPPVAHPDAVTVDEDDAAGVTFDVLANDTDVDAGDTLSVLSYDGSTVTNGVLTHASGGTFGYVPDPGFVGTETFTYVAADGSGATSPTTVTITVAPVQHAPVAGNDAYTTVQDTPLSVAAPGILGNDGDQDGDPITVQTAPVSGPAHGAVTLNADGSFVYTPAPGYSGPDSFVYHISDGTGRSAEGTVDVTVTASAAVFSTLYFQGSGPTPDIWNMTPAPPPAASSLFDFDGDFLPGLTLKNSSGNESTVQSSKFQIWTYTTAAPLVLNGPVSLDLWSSTGPFGASQEGTLYAYLYDCTPGGATDPGWSGCTRIASNVAVNDPWNTSLVNWGYRSITIGTVTSTIPAGNELRVRLLFQQKDLWLTMTAAYPSALVVTLG